MTKLHGVVGRAPGERYFDIALAEKNGYVNQRGLSRKHIFESVKHSLERLQLDYIDLLQCHRFDKETPVEETMQALHDVVQAGYVRYIGMSSCWAYQFHQMQNYAISHNLTPFISMQNHYSLVYREEEREMMPTLEHFGVGSIPWSPLARGALTRPLGERTLRADNDIWHDTYLKEPSNQAVVNRVEEIAKKHSVSMAQISLAWVMAKDVVSAPIVGTTSLDKLKDLLGALQVKLTEEDIKYLEEPYKPTAIIGHS
ncbi:Aldo/keto reductase [Artomyces pyxidatus]|uniref:Aldo/keto reductase n=1 Tax=Artomyces pyxidatus TaxID=48021 RepID=A0ACB8SFJ4_9AGAM|nr:Aldo/keto reductase [Artomyces pyxidatus]